MAFNPSTVRDGPELSGAEMAAHSLPPGTKRLTADGYVRVKVQDHVVFGTGWILEHHLNFFEATGFIVPKGYTLHHDDENKKNNDPKNLILMTNGEHSRLHRQKGVPWNKGKTGVYSEERIEKFRQNNRERVWSEESRNKASEFAKSRNDLQRDKKGRYHGTRN